jgi:hypothetical protein
MLCCALWHVVLLLTIPFELDLNLDVMVEVEALGGLDTEETCCTQNVCIMAYEF